MVSGKSCTEIRQGVEVEIDGVGLNFRAELLGLEMRVVEGCVQRVALEPGQRGCQKPAVSGRGTRGSGQRGRQHKGHEVGPGQGRTGRLGWDGEGDGIRQMRRPGSWRPLC